MSEIPFINWPRHWALRAVPNNDREVIIHYQVKTRKGHVDIELKQPYLIKGLFWYVWPVKGRQSIIPLENVDELLKTIKIAGSMFGGKSGNL